ncbi:hypothetical protein J2T55_002385 [Methylohalomonas lacus]|uniref:Uncharacterized protein n=1 Tax=Methylohalomonas lacus TaxID=398773 RepID=A0AAE3HNF5_9GAMM|nr:hypothetical protein [Methylohalomonas lacus]
MEQGVIRSNLLLQYKPNPYWDRLNQGERGRLTGLYAGTHKMARLPVISG